MRARTRPASTPKWRLDMRTRSRHWLERAMFVLTFAGLLTPGLVAPARAQAPPAPAVLRLQDLERMALERNPTMSQADASVRAAEGRRTQAGIYPNPLVGYQLEGLNTREPGRN